MPYPTNPQPWAVTGAARQQAAERAACAKYRQPLVALLVCILPFILAYFGV